MSHTSLCVFTVNFWFGDYAIGSEEWLLNQSEKESSENLEMSVLVFMKYQEEKLKHFCQYFVL